MRKSRKRCGDCSKKNNNVIPKKIFFFPMFHLRTVPTRTKSTHLENWYRRWLRTNAISFSSSSSACAETSQEGGELRDTAAPPTRSAECSFHSENAGLFSRTWAGAGRGTACACRVRGSFWCLQHTRVCRATCSSTVCHGTCKVCER